MRITMTREEDPSVLWANAKFEHIYAPPWFDFQTARIEHIPSGRLYGLMLRPDGRRTIICEGTGMAWSWRPGTSPSWREHHKVEDEDGRDYHWEPRLP